MGKTGLVLFAITLLLLPAASAMAKPLDATSTPPIIQDIQTIIKIKAFFDRVNEWFKANLGIDLYRVSRLIFDFLVRLAVDIFHIIREIVPKIREVLAG